MQEYIKTAKKRIYRIYEGVNPLERQEMLEDETNLIINAFIFSRMMSLYLLKDAGKVKTPSDWLRIQLHGGTALFNLILCKIMNHFIPANLENARDGLKAYNLLKTFLRNCLNRLKEELGLKKLIICMDEAQVTLKLHKIFSATNTPVGLSRREMQDEHGVKEENQQPLFHMLLRAFIKMGSFCIISGLFVNNN